MARFSYDVNTRTRLIDVYKQFNGGLKTVDTDDALGSVFLRQAENVSLSEFGFIEKRYGTFQKELVKTMAADSVLQGYWEYFGFSIFVVDGVFYYKGTGDAVAIDKIYQESTDPDAPSTIYGQEWRYPTIMGNTSNFTQTDGCVYTVTSTVYASDNSSNTPENERGVCGVGEFLPKANYTICTLIESGPTVQDLGGNNLTAPYYKCDTYTASSTTRTTPVYTPSFPQVDGVYRDMNAVNVNNVLYVFTGKYPVYIKIVTDSTTGLSLPRIYLFPITIPSYDEIVVTGHNLLEENYNQVYFKTAADIEYTDPGVSTNSYALLTNNVTNPGFFAVQKDNTNAPEEKRFAPAIPFQDGGQLHFNFKYAFDPTYLQAYNSSTQPRVYILDVDKVSYRSSGPGAVDYVDTDRSFVDFTPANNYTGSASLTASIEGAIARQNITTDYTQGISSPGGKDLHFFNQKTLVSSDNTFSDIEFSMDVDSQRFQRLNNQGLDIVPRDEFLQGEDFEFRLLKLTNAVTGATEPLFIPRTGGDIEDFYYDTFSEISGQNWSVLSSNNIADQPTITIMPVDSNGNELTNFRKNIRQATGLTRTSSGYKFTVPSDLIDSTVVDGYKVTLTGKFEAERRVNTSGTSAKSTPSIVYKELVKLEVVSDHRDLTTATNIGLTLNNLISGTYDFKLRYKLSKFTLNAQDVLEIVDGDDGVEFAEVFFYDIPITSEKLQDIPGQTDDFLPKAKPIWSCNKVMEHYGKLMVWGSTEMPTALFYSFPDLPTYFPSKFYLDFTNDTNQPLEAVTPYMNILVAQTASRTFGIRGNSGLIDAPSPYSPFGINSTVGTIAYKSVRPVRNHLFFLSKQGVIALKSLYAADEQYNIEFVDRNIRNIVPQDSDAVGIQFDNQYWLNFPNNSITLRWYIDKKAWVKDVYQGWSDFNGVFKYQIAGGKLEYISYPSQIGTEDPTIYKIGFDYSLPTDLYQPIKAKFETSFLNQNYPFHPKNYKEAKLDFTLQNEYNKGRLAVYDSSAESCSLGNTYTTQASCEAAGGTWAKPTVTYNPSANTISLQLGNNIKLEKNHRYRVDFFFNESTNSDGDIIYTTIVVNNPNGIKIEGQTSYINSIENKNASNNTSIATEFTLTNADITTTGVVDIEFTVANLTTPDGDSYITLRDVTYDDQLTFSTYVISEDQTLNFDNFSGYDQATADVGVDLTAKERLGDWTFGTSDFGKKVTAVKTIKLSGKGYNSKLYLEDTSKSKWTLESLGITYKMKRARSR